MKNFRINNIGKTDKILLILQEQPKVTAYKLFFIQFG
jgi:hypothetical protein